MSLKKIEREDPGCSLFCTGNMSRLYSTVGIFDGDPPSVKEDDTITITADEARYISKTYLGQKISKAIRNAANSPTVTELVYENVGQEKITPSIVDELRRKGFIVEQQRANEYFPEGGWRIKWGQNP